MNRWACGPRFSEGPLSENKMIQTDELQIKLQVVDRTVEGVGGPYLEWIQFKVQAAVPGFSADVKWAAMPTELLKFRDELAQMEKMVPDTKAELKSIESGVMLLLKLGHRGQIQGEYEITEQYSNPDGATLKGAFTIDQTYLRNIITEVDALLAYPARKLDA
jgi:hypothetical protein